MSALPAAVLDAVDARDLDPEARRRLLLRLNLLAIDAKAEGHVLWAARHLDPAHVADDGGIPDDEPVFDYPDLAPDVEPLTPPEPPAFPLHIFPDWVRDMIEEVALELQTPPDLPATAALGVLSLVCNRADITVNVSRGSWIEGTNLYLTCALPPGGSKSPVFSHMTRPLADLQAGIDDAHREAMARWKAQAHQIDEAVKDAAKDAKGGGAPERELHTEALISQAEHERDKPRRARVHLADTTPEALIDPVADSGGRTAIMSPEGTFFGALARYVDKGRDANIDIYLCGFSGDPYSVDRRNRDEPVHIPQVRLVICVLTQPWPLHKILSDPNNVARGLSDRFMVSEPVPTVGKRKFKGHNAEVTPQTAEKYAQGIQSLLDILEPEQLLMSAEAWDEFNDWRDLVESQRNGRWAVLAGAPEKVHQAVARLAAILHITHGDTGEIGLRRMLDACHVGDYWLETAHRIATETPEDVVDRAARKVWDWIVTERLSRFSLRELRVAGVVRGAAGFTTYEEIAPVVERLERAGLVALPEERDGLGWPGSGTWWDTGRGRPSPIVTVIGDTNSRGEWSS